MSGAESYPLASYPWSPDDVGRPEGGAPSNRPGQLRGYGDQSPLLGAGPGPSSPPNLSSVNIHQYLFSESPTRSRRRLRQSVVRWLPEILSSLLSLACVVAIAAVLAVYDRREPPSWPLGITLNTFLAFFTSIAKFGLIVPIMEGLGQLRWIWFSRRPRRLTDFELFERACRGAFGSVKLLFSFKGGVLVFLGTLVIIASLFTSPITQQIVQYPTRISAINGTASAPRTAELRPVADLIAADSSTVANAVLAFKEHLLPGAYTRPERTLPDLAPSCSSGDCEFPDFVSLGVCTQATDLTDQLAVAAVADRDWQLVGLDDNRTWSASLPGFQPLVVPNLHAFDIWSPYPGMPLREPPSAERNLSLADMILVYSNRGEAGGAPAFRAVEVLFYWCTKAFSLRVVGGEPQWTERARAAHALGPPPDSLNLATNTRYLPCIVSWAAAACVRQFRAGNVTLAAPPGFEGAVVADEMTALVISSMFQLSFWSGRNPPPWATTAPFVYNVGGQFLLGDTVYRIGGDISMALGAVLWRNPAGVPDPAQQFEAVANMTANMGKAIENFIRSYLDPSTSAPGLAGIVRGPKPYVQIRWVWLVFLCLELLLSTLFLVGTIVVTKGSRMQIIKCSSLATMCALDEPTRRRLGDIHDLEAVEDTARRTNVRLEKAVSGLAVWLSGSRRSGV